MDRVIENPGYAVAWLAVAIAVIYVCSRLDTWNGSLLRRHPPGTQRYWDVLGLRTLTRIVMAGSTIAVFMFCPIQCSSSNDDGCHTETDNRGTHVICD